MSWFLYCLSRWCYRHRITVVAAWLVLLIGLGTGAATLSKPTSNAFTVPGLESTEAMALIEERTPEANPDGATARVVFQAPSGAALSDSRTAVEGTLATIESEKVASIVSPFLGGSISQDGRTGYATVNYSVATAELSADDRAELEGLTEIGSGDGLLIAVGGDATESEVHLGATELLGVAVALIVLVLTLGTLLAAGMSMFTAIIGVGIGVAAITAATGFISLGSTTPLLATMLGLAVGIDYALFIVSRYRHELTKGRSPEEATGRAVGTAGSAVIFAGLTVVIALAGLSLVNIRFLSEMGLAAALTVVIAVLIAITLLPALFRLVGTRVLRSRLPFMRTNEQHMAGEGATLGQRWVGGVAKRRVFTFVAGLVIAAVVAVPALSMELALPDQGTSPEGSQSRIAYDLISENFGAGVNGPLVVVVDTAEADNAAAAIEEVNGAIASIQQDVAAVVPAGPVAPTPEAAAAFQQQLEVLDYAVTTVVPTTGPSDVATKELVEEIRDVAQQAGEQVGATVYVTGQTAVGIDVSQSLSDAFPLYLSVVVGLAFILLLVVFRSIWVPVKAVLGFLISVAMALGAIVAVNQWGWGADIIGIDSTGPVLSMLPLLLTGILFGLAMDYELFLVSRMREDYIHGASAKDAVKSGFAHSARIVTAAAIIMISVFASFALVDDPILKMMGFSLAFGVFADAFLVRMTLVPAVMSILGERIWWMPKWLDRLLPNLDLEGERLTHRLDESPRQ